MSELKNINQLTKKKHENDAFEFKNNNKKKPMNPNTSEMTFELL